jgi:hypothetical protein
MNFRMRSIGVLLAVTPLALVSFCKEGAVNFTLENQTNETLYAWGFYESCQQSPGNQQDYFNRVLVRPGETLRYSKDSPGPPHDVNCVQATDSSRRLVLSEPYKRGAIYVVDETRPIRADPLPQFDQLPSQPWLDRQREDFNEDPAGYIVSVVVIVGFLTFLVLGFVVAIAYGVAYAIRQSRSRKQSNRT